ncbi:sulfotransferase [Pseudomonas sp. PDM16]|uniref:sulfotransferase family protein n=1 Tax=Pseudomonas sp. PDM16 TaxID=2769292 RepID=UPI00177B3C41|nr:sulfotransferase [Pseudomonas sp. PDM16]MBD9414006.1 sulfotransferase [Pseudomonas sp. PDM16]
MAADILSFEVGSIVYLPLPDEVEGFGLDTPVAQSRLVGHRISFVGWAVGRFPYTVESLNLMDGQRLVKCVPVNVPRSDLAALCGQGWEVEGRPGFHSFIGGLGLRRAVELDIVLNLHDSRDGSWRQVKVATVCGRTRNHLQVDSKYQPLMLTAIARSGTTLAMQIFGEHRGILTSNFYPYEVKQSAYWGHVLKVLVDPADFDGSSHPDDFEKNIGFVGHNPYCHEETLRQLKGRRNFHEHYNNHLPLELAKFAVARINEFYELIAKGERKTNATYFAEKFLPTHLQPIFHDIFRSPKEIVLTRDFRDVICSAQSFNQKRNSQSFGRGEATNDLEWITGFSSGVRSVAEAWLDRGHSALHVRYEDLVLQPEAQIRRVFDYLEVEASDVLISLIRRKIFESSQALHHMTASSPEKSVGRWQRDMPDELLEHCHEHFGQELKLFGYQ